MPTFLKRAVPFAALMVACSTDPASSAGTSDAGAAAGSEGGACYPNATCNAGLSCFSSLCVRVPAEAGAVADASDGDATTANDAGNADAADAADAHPAPTLSADIQPIFTQACATSGCHILPTPPLGLILSAGVSHSNLVGVASVEDSAHKRVEAGNAAASYMYLGITGHPAAGANVMPPPAAVPDLTNAQRDMIRDWINAGALAN